MTQKFKCANCGTEHDSTGRCEECGDIVREYLPMDSPVYEVEIPGVGPVWFPESEYGGAFEHATGRLPTRVDDEIDGESRIKTVEFDGPVEVPVADI